MGVIGPSSVAPTKDEGLHLQPLLTCEDALEGIDKDRQKG